MLLHNDLHIVVGNFTRDPTQIFDELIGIDFWIQYEQLSRYICASSRTNMGFQGGAHY